MYVEKGDVMKTLDVIKGTSKLSDQTFLGSVHLKVRDINRQIEFYTKVLRMTLHDKGADYAVLGDTETPFIYLKQYDNLKAYQNTTGMYHFALLYPSEEELAKAIFWLLRLRYPNSPTDHGLSKTTYLRDAEGNEIELYVRTPDRGHYVDANGELMMQHNDGRIDGGREALDLHELFKDLNKEDDFSAPISDMQLGHIHLYGSNLDEMLQFYRDVIGFAEGVYFSKFGMCDMSLSEEKYHVIAFNSWKNTRLQYPEDSLGFDYYTLKVTRQNYDEILERVKQANLQPIINENGVFVKDPSGIKIKIQAIG